MAARGELPVVFRVSTDRQIAAALSIASASGLELTLMGADGISETLDLLEGARVRIAVAAPTLSGGHRAEKLPALLMEKGVGVAIFAGSPKSSPEALRIGAVLAVRGGMSSRAALAAITSVPASMAGCEGRVGTLSKGCSADFSVFSGPPLDLSSAHLETWVSGKRVFTRTAVVVPTRVEGEDK
jgi:imidazolonepropionase-like amidohydrolase